MAIEMIECLFCQATNAVKNNICSQCGTYQFGHGKIGQTTADRKQARSVQPGFTPIAIRLKIGASKREDVLLLTKDIYIGRQEPALKLYPEIDLAHDGPSADTVSRQHAVISKKFNQVFVEDLESTNGTFVNGNRIYPHMREPLKSGDILHFGRVSVEVEIPDPGDWLNDLMR